MSVARLTMQSQCVSSIILLYTASICKYVLLFFIK